MVQTLIRPPHLNPSVVRVQQAEHPKAPQSDTAFKCLFQKGTEGVSRTSLRTAAGDGFRREVPHKDFPADGNSSSVSFGCGDGKLGLCKKNLSESFLYQPAFSGVPCKAPPRICPFCAVL